MKLTELEPRWIHPNIFVFLCPCCRKILLSCKNIEMPRSQIWDILTEERDKIGMEIVPCKPEQSWSWSISGSVPIAIKAAFPTDLTVTPSIDASASGHWHGFITNGGIT